MRGGHSTCSAEPLTEGGCSVYCFFKLLHFDPGDKYFVINLQKCTRTYDLVNLGIILRLRVNIAHHYTGAIQQRTNCYNNFTIYYHFQLKVEQISYLLFFFQVYFKIFAACFSFLILTLIHLTSPCSWFQIFMLNQPVNLRWFWNDT